MTQVSRSGPRVQAWDEVAELYGEGVSPFGLLSQELVRLAALRPGDRALDLGTGNGLGLVPAARAASTGFVVGVDSSPAMLRAAQRRAADTDASNVALVLGDVGRLGFADGRFDVAMASSVFQFVGYAPEVLVEWRRVLRLGGRLVVSVPVAAAEPRASSVLRTLITENRAKLPAELADKIQGDPPQPPDLEELCTRAGFRACTLHTYEPHVVVSDVHDWWAVQWSHGARVLLRAFDDSTLVAMKARAAELLHDVAGEGGAIPLDLKMAICVAVS
jgi:ubiquinone/menaquinone biosynthesis C-methylase UbiE